MALRRLLGTGNYGVQLFFVLSGFLLASPFAKWRLGQGKRPSLRAYYLRRLTRLEPPYFVSMILCFVAGFAVYGSSVQESHWRNLLASMVYAHNVIYGKMSVINAVTWSLEIEIQFYIIAPLLACIFSVRHTIVRRSILVSAVAGIPLLRSFIPETAALPGNIASTHLFLLWHIEFFLTGFLLVELYIMNWKETPSRSLRWDVASLFGWPSIIFLILSRQSTVLMAFVILVAYIGAFRGKISSWILRRPLITTIGGMCYSIYLVHSQLIVVCVRSLDRLVGARSYITSFLLISAASLPLVTIASIILFALVERPCMDPTWPRQLAGLLSRRSVSELHEETV